MDAKEVWWQDRDQSSLEALNGALIAREEAMARLRAMITGEAEA